MKKSIKQLALAAFVLLAGSGMTANAQLLSEKPHVHFGVRAGLSVSSWSGEGMKALAFPTGGLAVDFKVAPIPLYLETGAYFINKGYKYRRSYDADTYETKHVLGGEIPVVASYHYYFTDDMAIQPFFGGFVSFQDDGYDNVDAGLRFGTGFNYRRLYANVGYDLGLKNMNGDSDYSCKSGFFFVTIGYNFVGSK